MIVAVPAKTPVTKPLPEPTVATVVVPLLHVPPVVASLKLVVKPAQTFKVPVIAEGNGLTVKIAVVIQPVGKVYVIVALPLATPVITPVPEPAVAIVISLLLQLPPTVTSLNVVVKPEQTLSVPDIDDGSGLTVIIAVILQPVGNV